MDFEILTQLALFENFSQSEIEQLLGMHRHSVQKFKPENVIVSLGDECDQLGIIVKGKVRAEMIDDTGKVIKIEDLMAPDILAPAFLFAKKNEYPVTVTATTDCELLFIEKNAFVDLLQRNKKLFINYLTIISDRSKFLSEKILFLAFRTLKHKLAVFILRRAQEQQKHDIQISETQQELADYFGVARPSLARSLAQLESEGLIEIKSKHIQIKDLNRLREVAK